MNAAEDQCVSSTIPVGRLATVAEWFIGVAFDSTFSSFM
jgi:hypothetical protein